MSWTNPTTPNVTDYTAFLYSVAEIQPGVLPSTSEDIPLSLSVAVATVNEALQLGGTYANAATGIVTLSLYVLAVYNLATDRLVNWANDVPGQTLFKDTRDAMGLMRPAVGVATSAADQGTAGTLINPEQLKMLTLDDLQTLRTPWGRRYLGIAQAYGTVIWGLS
jgi:hypothetical protein